MSDAMKARWKDPAFAERMRQRRRRLGKLTAYEASRYYIECLYALLRGNAVEARIVNAFHAGFWQTAGRYIAR